MGDKAFNRANYLTVKELATIVEKSQQSVYRRLERKQNKTKYLRTYDGKMYVHKSAVWDLYGIDAGFTIHSDNVSDSAPEQQNDAVDVDSSAIPFLMEQIQKKDKQLEDMQRTIDNLSEALKAEQVLRANADKRILMLETMAKDQTATKDTDADQEQPQAPDATETTTEAVRTSTDASESVSDGIDTTVSPAVSEEPQDAQKKPKKKRSFWQWFFGF